MKRIKINLLLVAMVLGCTVAFAFKAPKAPGQTPQTWYYQSGSVDDPSDYSTTPLPGGCPSGTTNICSIVADPQSGNPNLPNITPSLQTRIDAKDPSNMDVFLKH